MSSTPSPSISQEAHTLINGPRRAAYGTPQASFSRVARMWSEVLGMPVTAHQVALCMVALKLCRENHAHTRDNLVDICGYADLAGQVWAGPAEAADSKLPALSKLPASPALTICPAPFNLPSGP